MKKNTIDLSASVKARLLNKAKEMNGSFLEVMQNYGMERFIYRVSCSKHRDKFILKGALMFNVWQISERRTTMDVDFSGSFDNDVKNAENIIREICNTAVIPDGLIFDAESVTGKRIREESEYEGVRVKFKGYLGRSRISMQIDIGFGDSVYPKPKVIEYPSVLGFPVAKIRGYRPETMVSEKYETIIKIGKLNSRMKDFYDIWLLMHKYEFSGKLLVKALKKTFNQRETSFPIGSQLIDEDFYDLKSERQALWRAFIKKEEIEFAPMELPDVVKLIEDFLKEPVEAIIKKNEFNKRWNVNCFWE